MIFSFLFLTTPPAKYTTFKKQNPEISKVRVAGNTQGNKVHLSNLRGQAGTTAASENKMCPHYFC